MFICENLRPEKTGEKLVFRASGSFFRRGIDQQSLLRHTTSFLSQGMFSGPSHVEKVFAAFGATVCGEGADFSSQEPDLDTFDHSWSLLVSELA